MSGVPVIQAPGAQLACSVSGAGPPVLFLHDMGSGAQEAPAIAAALVAAYDRRGYGASSAPESYTATTVSEQAEDALAVLAALDCGPPLLCAEGFGALIALDLLLRGACPLRGAALHNAPLLSLVPDAAEGLAADRAGLEAALRSGGARAAVDAWRGAPSPPAVERGFFADFAGLASLSFRRAQLRAIDVPVRVSWDERATANVRAASAALLALLPSAVRAENLADGVSELQVSLP